MSSSLTLTLMIPFNIDNYYKNLYAKVHQILSRSEARKISFDILSTPKTERHRTIVLSEQQFRMKIGEIWQEALGSYNEYNNLNSGHESGLDIISYKNKVAIELKNRTNTDNSSSKLANYDKLARFKRSNSEYTCIYATINDNTEQNTYKPRNVIKKIQHKNVEIEHHTGYPFLKFVLKNDTDNIINFLKKTINEYEKII